MDVNPLPSLRPHARQGKAYYAELRAILKEIEHDVFEEIRAFRRAGGKITPAYIGHLALKYELNCKAMFEALEDWNLIPCGTYDKVTRSHRPTAILRAGQEWRP
jgi:hypothetical protein